MATRIHTPEILDAIIDLINTNLGVSLGLKTIAKGDVKHLIGPDGSWGTHLPAVLVKPAPSTDLEFSQLNQGYDVIHRVRIVYLKQWDVGDLVVEDQMTPTVQIAELLIDTIALDVTLSNGQVRYSRPAGIDWDPEEDRFLQDENLQIKASAIVFDVMVRTRK